MTAIDRAAYALYQRIRPGGKEGAGAEAFAHQLAHLALSAALADTCHESVPAALGDEGPCDRPMVGYRVDDEDSTYPVCSRHMRAPMAPLKAVILGGVDGPQDLRLRR